MIAAGCDVGSLTGKAVIIKDNEIIASKVMRAVANPTETSNRVMAAALSEAGLSLDDIDYAIATGYGRRKIPFAEQVESEITCHGKGAWWLSPDVRTIIDIGGQDAKAIKLDEQGNIIRYVYNDKCASGTGRFLEIMADALDVELEAMGELSALSTRHIDISSQCVVFAESEIISLVNDGKEIPDILKALNNAMANRIISLAKSIKVEGHVVITGGVAKNSGIYQALSERISAPMLKLPVDPQTNGALGAAVLAMEALGPQKNEKKSANA